MVDIFGGEERKVDVLRETVRTLVADVMALKDNTSAMKTDLALTRQAQDQFRTDVKEYMMRSDLGRTEQSTKLDMLLRNKVETDFSKRALTIAFSLLLGLATIWTAYSAWITAEARGH